MEFKELKLDTRILEGLDMMGISKLTPIQEEAIPKILEGKNIIGASQTGTGKTAAFLVPVMQKLLENHKPDTIQCLILSPTRELAKQIDSQIMGIGFYTGLSSVSVIGGGSPQEWDQQEKGLKNKCDIIVATPGRLLMHLNLEYVDFSGIDVLVIDEADRLLELGFQEDIKTIVSKVPETRQNLLFSATMPPKVKKLTSWVMEEAEQIRISPSQPATKVYQVAYLAEDRDKSALLKHLGEKENIESMIVFTGRKKNVNVLAKEFSKLGFSAEGIHSDKTQEEREEALRLFKGGKLNVLVATDILARGIDIEGVSHVVNYEAPRDVEDYIHRIGRTARAEKKGVAITFVSPDEVKGFKKLEGELENPIDKKNIPEEIGKQPNVSYFFAAPQKHQPGKKSDNKPPFKKKNPSGSGKNRRNQKP